LRSDLKISQIDENNHTQRNEEEPSNEYI
jgi:hypothetical protein